ncbi:myb-related transcription factor, partner of profilin-like [Engraulis encrasicolus]|uniref:myb-related transcription factor, partner of profilin-like n=1 Tax=Engraulis encrasicolus TaxID=184585 RepID=UPI002FD1C98B
MARKPTFTAQEIDVLVDEVERKRLLLFSKFKNTVTNADKKAAWEEVAQRAIAVGLGYNRTAEMVRNKWRDYSSVTKMKAAALRREQQRTGGGTHSQQSLSPIKERVLGEEALAGTPCLPPEGLTTPPPCPNHPQSTRTASAVSPYPRRRQSRRCHNHCDCYDTHLRYEAEKVALLRRIQGDLTALREQRQRHHEEVMAYRRKKLALLAAASAKTAAHHSPLGTLSTPPTPALFSPSPSPPPNPAFFPASPPPPPTQPGIPLTYPEQGHGPHKYGDEVEVLAGERRRYRSNHLTSP